jgi:DNA-binding beta-propeller fold protein YncE
MSSVSHERGLFPATPRPTTLLGCLLACLSAVGCYKPDDGREPPLERIYFPTAVALSPDGNRLYVANSDWDLQFNAGSVQVYDALRLRERLPRYCDADADCASGSERCDLASSTDANGVARAPTHWCVDAVAADPCSGLGQQTAADRSTSPGLCAPLDNRDPELLLGSVRIGAFATNLLYRANPAGGGRLFVPVRSDATLHWIDVGGGAGGREIECGQDSSGECDENHRRGDSLGESTVDGDELPIEPFGIDASRDGTAIVVTHQTEGQVSLFVNDWSAPEDGPRLSSILNSELSLRPSWVNAIPVPELARLDRLSPSRQLGYRPGFWLGYRGQPFVQLLRYFDPVDSPDGVPFLESAFADRVTTTGTSDVRDLAVDDSARRRCEEACGAALGCLAECAGVGLDVYLSNSVPASLLTGHTTSMRRGEVQNDRLQISAAVALDVGVGRVVLGDVTDLNGQLARRVFVASFDSRTLTIYDPGARAIEARIQTGRGPSAVAVDSPNALAYVTHFTDSYIGVVDLDKRHATFGTIIRALGEPTPPRGDE